MVGPVAPDEVLMSVDEWVGVVDRAIQLVGEDHVALGSDFDGGPTPARHMRDVRDLSMITDAMLRRGYSKDRIRKFLGGNLMRVFRQVTSTPKVVTPRHLQTSMANTLTDPIDPVFTRREMLGTTGMAGLAALTGIASGAVAQTDAESGLVSPVSSALGGDAIACGLDRHQVAGRVLVAGRPHAFACGRGVGLHPSA